MEIPNEPASSLISPIRVRSRFHATGLLYHASVVGASILMVLAMVLLGLAPRNGGMILVICCLANRVLSGMAEGMGSGADEALVFDSLAERNRSSEWPLVLDQVMRWQAVGMVIAMLVGARKKTCPYAFWRRHLAEIADVEGCDPNS